MFIVGYLIGESHGYQRGSRDSVRYHIEKAIKKLPNKNG